MKFTLYWLDGKREVVEGNSISEAMTLAGYGGGAVRALDFYADGNDHNYTWKELTSIGSTKKVWQRKP